jgi:hypothetical protein
MRRCDRRGLPHGGRAASGCKPHRSGRPDPIAEPGVAGQPSRNVHSTEKIKFAYLEIRFAYIGDWAYLALAVNSSSVVSVPQLQP